MTDESTPGGRLRRAVADEHPLQVVGTINAYHAIMAERVGYRALYLSGGGVAAASYGLPDLGITTLENVLDDVRRITDVTETPLLVDVDTGWGGAFNIARTVQAHDPCRRRRHAHRGPGPGQALRSPPRQGHRAAATRWSTASERRSTRAATRLRHHGAHRCARRRKAWRRRSTAAAAYVEAGRRHDLSRGGHESAAVPRASPRRCRCPCWPTSPSSAPRRYFTTTELRERRGRPGAVPPLRFPGHEQGGARTSTRRSARRAARRASSRACRRGPSSTSSSATTPTNKRSTNSSPRRRSR